TNIADEVSRRVRMAVRMTVEARDAEMRLLAAPIVRHVELLLRKRAHEQTQSFQLLRVQNAVEELEKVLRRDELPLRHVAELGSRGQENGRRELGQEMLGNVELDVEAVQIALLLREDLVDVVLGEDHAAFLVERMRQRLEPFGKEVSRGDLRSRHRRELLPGAHAFRQPDP